MIASHKMRMGWHVRPDCGICLFIFTFPPADVAVLDSPGATATKEKTSQELRKLPVTNYLESQVLMTLLSCPVLSCPPWPP